VAADFRGGVVSAYWLLDAEAADGNRPGVTRTESSELGEVNRRIRLLDHGNEVLRRAAA
jgi:hypothetical protein